MYKKYTRFPEQSKRKKIRHLLQRNTTCLQKRTLACKGNVSGGVCLLWWGIRNGAESFAAVSATEVSAVSSQLREINFPALTLPLNAFHVNV